MSEHGRLAGRCVVVVVTGGIAAYKSCELVRRLRDHGARVRVAMTRSATRFVGETTFAALSGERVISDLFADPRPEEIPHVRWAEEADLLCVAPATANFLAKLAHGIADDFASTLALAVRAPVLVAPAMEDDMYRHPATQRNLDTLRARGVVVAGPAQGALASGRQGPGRMLEAAELLDEALRVIEDGVAEGWLVGRRILVTAGPTREAIDPVRYLGNHSSGRMGYALAQEARRLGGRVTLVSGPTTLAPPRDVELLAVQSAEEMATATLRLADEVDVVVMAAAVADFTPVHVAAEKVKKVEPGAAMLQLRPTTDILAELGRRQPRPVLVGFAAETSEVRERGLGKLRDKGADVLVANRVGGGLGMGAEDNEVVVVDRWGGERAFGPAAKSRVATFVWGRLRELMITDEMDGRGGA